MPLITWDESLSVKVAELDGEHRKLVGMINTLHDAMREGKGKDALDQTLNDMVRYAQTHFAHEERLMQTTKYPGYLAHKAAHEQFVKQVQEMLATDRGTATGLPMKLMAVLKDWLTTHIKGSDQKYSTHFINNGVR